MRLCSVKTAVPESLIGKRELSCQADTTCFEQSSFFDGETEDKVEKKLKITKYPIAINKEYRGGLISRFRQGLGQFTQNLSENHQTKLFGEQWAGFRHGFNFKSVISTELGVKVQRNQIEGQYEFGLLDGICKIDFEDPALGNLGRYVGYMVKD